MKRTCNSCLASEWDTGSYVCRLDYNINIKDGVPKEECPKPLTNQQFVDAKPKRQV